MTDKKVARAFFAIGGGGIYATADLELRQIYLAQRSD